DGEVGAEDHLLDRAGAQARHAHGRAEELRRRERKSAVARSCLLVARLAPAARPPPSVPRPPQPHSNLLVAVGVSRTARPDRRNARAFSPRAGRERLLRERGRSRRKERVMPVWLWVVVAVAAAVAVVLQRRRARSAHLRERFGPEYVRAVAEAPSRAAAEKELAERERRSGEL